MPPSSLLSRWARLARPFRPRHARANPARLGPLSVVTLMLLLLLSWALVRYDHHQTGLVLPFGAGTPPALAAPVVLRVGGGTFHVAGMDGPVVGTSGPLLRYQVAVEDGLGVPVEGFAAAVEAVLADPRSWIAGGHQRLQRGSGTGHVDFTVILASPVLSERMCREDGLRTEQFTNCRLSDGRVVINSARWLTGVPGYSAPLVEYRAYVINHEVGHQLGHGHELCPGPGQPAPVMQQQTLGLDGCQPYGWPFRDGVRYAGPTVY
jgi:hypothetical protein